MFGIASWGNIFFNKSTTRAAEIGGFNLRGNFSLFGDLSVKGDYYFAVAPLWKSTLADKFAFV
jgi:hypothetical protein